MACPKCNLAAGFGSGDTNPMPCSLCGGSGKQVRETSDGKVVVIECAHCNGTGTCRNSK